MRFLVTNDDGIYSPGIAALARAASHFGDVIIVAPNVEQSSMGHAITSRRPITYTRTPIEDFEAYRVDGTPADCVALGTHLWGGVEYVLSGINIGLNIGNGMWHSGTLAAAKQATLLGVCGIAFSAPAAEDIDYEHLDPFVSKVLERLIGSKNMKLVNVNLPERPQGVRWTRQSVRMYDGVIVPGQDPIGREHFWFTVEPIQETEEGTDRWAVENGWVSLTPLRLDLTDEAELERLNRENPVD